jgi:hypothetical protein
MGWLVGQSAQGVVGEGAIAVLAAAWALLPPILFRPAWLFLAIDKDYGACSFLPLALQSRSRRWLGTRR